jgi:KaiC/GvpD/RAD55 family RecA-like ATPase
MSFLKQHKIHFLFFATLAVSTAVFGYLGYFENTRNNIQEARITEMNTITEESSKIVYTSVDNFNSVEQKTVLEIENQSYPINIEAGNTAYDLMKHAEAAGYIRFSTNDYGGDLGRLVEEINGIRNSARDKKYWIYYINGKKATVGISNYQPQSGDIISWQYEDETF